MINKLFYKMKIKTLLLQVIGIYYLQEMMT